MIIVLLICLWKSMFYLKVIKSFSYIVTMIKTVIVDLKVFMIFFIIMITMFSLAMDVIA